MHPGAGLEIKRNTLHLNWSFGASYIVNGCSRKLPRLLYVADMANMISHTCWRDVRARLTRFAVLGGLFIWVASTQAQPLTLTYRDAVRMALAANPELRIVQFEEAVAQARMLQARKRTPPDIGLEGEDYLDVFTGQHSASLEPVLGIFAEQDLGIWGQRRRRILASEAGLLRVRSEIRDVQRLISRLTGEVYLTFLLAQRNLAAAEDALAHLQETLSVVESRVSSGESAGLELMRLQINLFKSESEVRLLRLTLEQMRTNLLSILGHADLATPVIVIDSLTTAPLSAEDGTPIASIDGVLLSAEALIIRASASRPDLVALMHETTEAQAVINIERGLLWPSTMLIFGRRHHTHEAGSEFALQMSVPLLWGRNKGGVREAEASYDQTVARHEQTLMAMQNEVQQAIQSVNAHADRLRSFDVEYRETLESLHNGMHASYELGEATLSDLLDVHSTIYEVNLLHNSVLFDYNNSLVMLAAALGMPPI